MFQKIHNKIIQLQMTEKIYISPDERQKNIDNLKWVIIV